MAGRRITLNGAAGALLAAGLLVGAVVATGLTLSGCALYDHGRSDSTSLGAASSSSTAGLGSRQSSTSVAPGTTAPSSSTATTTSATTNATAAPSSSTASSSTAAPGTTASPTGGEGAPAKNYTKVPTTDKVVALTFDAAYDPTPLKAILAALQEAGAQATFFLTGEFVRDFPDWTKQIIAGGYPIGNHSYSHPDFTTISAKAMRDQLEKTAAALVKLGASDPRPLFRAPYGALNKQVLSVVGSEGYFSVFWTIDTLDWEPERTTAQIKATVLGKLQPGAIVLMHVGSKQEAEVLPEILSEIKARGYRFVNLREVLPGAGG